MNNQNEHVHNSAIKNLLVGNKHEPLIKANTFSLRRHTQRQLILSLLGLLAKINAFSGQLGSGTSLLWGP